MKNQLNEPCVQIPVSLVPATGIIQIVDNIYIFDEEERITALQLEASRYV